jgi:hypothetical protein
VHAETVKKRVQRDFVGTNPVVPFTPDQLVDLAKERAPSPVKQARVEGYMQSNGMKDSIRNYRDNDCTKGLVTVKPVSIPHSQGVAAKKDVWRPKISLKWHEPYRAPLTL